MRFADIITSQFGLHGPEPLELPKGRWRRLVYVYDGRPLKGIRTGKEIRLDVGRMTTTLKSIYTDGTLRASRGEWFSYQGKPVGLLADVHMGKGLAMLLDRHGAVSVVGVIEERPKGTWPELYVFLPSAYSMKKDYGIELDLIDKGKSSIFRSIFR